MNKTMKTTTSMENSTGSKSPAPKEVSTVAMESLVFPHVATKWPVSPAKDIFTKKELAEGRKAQNDTRFIMNQAARTI